MRIHTIGDAFLTFQRLHQLVSGCNMSNHDGHVRYICVFIQDVYMLVVTVVLPVFTLIGYL